MNDASKFAEETKKIRTLAASTSDYWYSDHAPVQMKERSIDKFDIKSTLLNGTVIEDQTTKPEESKWKVEGYAIDGRRLHVIAVVSGGEIEIGIITVWSKGKKKK
jgi:Domain of unknown function (DUF4258)